MCLGFDLLTNNSDRFKLLWGSDGNINNVLIEVTDYSEHSLDELRDRNNTSTKLGGYIFIDHSGYLLDLTNEFAAKNFERYMEKVCNLQTQIIKFLSDQGPAPKEFEKLK
jgi:endonuclease IV